jgi:hypothetical protein
MENSGKLEEENEKPASVDMEETDQE